MPIYSSCPSRNESSPNLVIENHLARSIALAKVHRLELTLAIRRSRRSSSRGASRAGRSDSSGRNDARRRRSRGRGGRRACEVLVDVRLELRRRLRDVVEAAALPAFGGAEREGVGDAGCDLLEHVRVDEQACFDGVRGEAEHCVLVRDVWLVCMKV